MPEITQLREARIQIYPPCVQKEGKGKGSLGEAGEKISQVKTGITVGMQKISGDKRLQKSPRALWGSLQYTFATGMRQTP